MLFRSTRDGSTPLYLNRKTSDGTIVDFRKDSATVGSIGTGNGGNLYIGSGDAGINFNPDVNCIYPINAGNAGGSDGVLDLGLSGVYRFKNLHLSGNVYANALIHEGDSDTYVAFLPDRIYMDRGGNRAFDADSGSTRFGRPNGSEAMRIDTSGNLLVGTTSTDYNSNVGFQVKPSGQVFATASSTNPALFNRRTTDGDIAVFRKDGTSVGSIGTRATYLTIGKDDIGLLFNSGSNRIQPENITTGAVTDNLVDLGYSGGRFKDLYLSGGVYLGGTGAANKLDDYEEGTWTPTQGTFTTWTSPTFTATYTKTGRMVQLNLQQTGGVVAASSGAKYIAGLPFTAAAFSVGSVSQGGVTDLGSCVASGTSLYFTNTIASENDLIVTVTYYV